MKEWQAPVFSVPKVTEGSSWFFALSGELIEGEYLNDWLDRCMAELGLPPFDEGKGLVGALHAAFERIEELQEAAENFWFGS